MSEFGHDKKQADGANEHLMISVRIRPLKSEEAARGWQRIIKPIDEKMLFVYEAETAKLDALRANRVKDKKFMFDVVFPEEVHQDTVYKKTTKPLIDDVLNGFNASIFAYGPTGTGKTFTMVGTPEQPGIMVRALNDLFKKMESGEERFKVSMSYLEIYNEQIRDLLNYTGKTLDLRENAKNGVIQVSGLSSIATTSTKEVMRLLQKGNKERICESTAANQTSSRSHAMLQVNVHLSSHESGGLYGEEVKTGRLFMIDLAGSERARMTKNKGIRLQEGAHINKSLLALGNVINALAEGRAKFVNFRDSKLTRLLKDALSGNCKTVMIAHISPASVHRDESKNTLTYADRAKNISNSVRQTKVDVTYHIEQYKKIIAELKQEITRLREKLSENGSSLAPKSTSDSLSQMKVDLVTSFTGMMELRKKIMNIDGNILSVSMELKRINILVDEWEAEQVMKDPSNKKRRSSSSSSIDGLADDEDMSEELKQACEDIIYLEGEQTRYEEMREAMEKEMTSMKKKAKDIEESLPLKANSTEQKEILNLLCKIHELEINQVELESEGLIKEHELRWRDLQIVRFDRQRNLCDEIITKQRSLIEEKNGSNLTPELEKLYHLYQIENQNMNSDRSPSVLSFPPISPNYKDSPEMLFKPTRRHSLSDDRRPSTPLTLRSPLSSALRAKKKGDHMPSIFGQRSANGSNSTSLTPSQSPTSRRKSNAILFPPIR